MKINIKHVKSEQVKLAKIIISAKCSDCCFTDLIDETGNSIITRDGYVPSFMPDGGGDYVELDIDPDTGRILNWTATKESIEEYINETAEENDD